jgi:hypothetical protein
MAVRGLVAALTLAVLTAFPAGALAQGGATPAQGQTPAPGQTPAQSPFDGNAMWIWQLPKAGSWAQVAKKAKANNVSALYIKSANGSYEWTQFTPAMVDYFQSQGLKVCGWAYLYGGSPKWGTPTQEAIASASAYLKDGADCFIMDPETEYEGRDRYVAADRYMTKLRQLVGPDFPVALATFPYVDFHGSMPYSVFLRPDGGAQGNAPQMYWDTIRVTPDRIFARTYGWNQLYGRPIYPIGQTYKGEGRSTYPKTADIKRFRRLAQAYGSTGVSWWEWTQSTSSGFRSATKPLSSVAAPKQAVLPTISRGGRGDWVVWAQEHLNGAGRAVPVTGTFGTQTQNAIRAFQTANVLPVTGKLDPATWQALLQVTPVSTRWASAKRGPASAAAVGSGGSAPQSAGIPAKRNELAGTPK